jgi:hypothetical protein
MEARRLDPTLTTTVCARVMICLDMEINLALFSCSRHPRAVKRIEVYIGTGKFVSVKYASSDFFPLAVK